MSSSLALITFMDDGQKKRGYLRIYIFRGMDGMEYGCSKTSLVMTCLVKLEVDNSVIVYQLYVKYK